MSRKPTKRQPGPTHDDLILRAELDAIRAELAKFRQTVRDCREIVLYRSEFLDSLWGKFRSDEGIPRPGTVEFRIGVVETNQRHVDIAVRQTVDRAFAETSALRESIRALTVRHERLTQNVNRLFDDARKAETRRPVMF